MENNEMLMPEHTMRACLNLADKLAHEFKLETIYTWEMAKTFYEQHCLDNRTKLIDNLRRKQ